MYSGLKIHLYTNNQGLLNGVINKVENATRVLEADYEIVPANYEIEEGNIVESLSIEISFIDNTARQGLVGLLSGLTGMIHACEKPSVVYGFDNNRPEGTPDVRTETYLEAV